MPAIIFSILSLGNFSYKNENAELFLSTAFTKFFIRLNLLYIEVEATLWTDLQEADKLCYFQVYIVYVDAIYSCYCEHFWQEYPIHRGKRIFCNSSAVPSKWQLPSNHHKFPTDMSRSSHTDNSLSDFTCTLSVDRMGNRV